MFCFLEPQAYCLTVNQFQCKFCYLSSKFFLNLFVCSFASHHNSQTFCPILMKIGIFNTQRTWLGSFHFELRWVYGVGVGVPALGHFSEWGLQYTDPIALVLIGRRKLRRGTKSRLNESWVIGNPRSEQFSGKINKLHYTEIGVVIIRGHGWPKDNHLSTGRLL